MSHGAVAVVGDSTPLDWFRGMSNKELKKLIMDIAGMDEGFQQGQRDLMGSMENCCPPSEVCRVARLRLSLNGSEWTRQFIALGQVPQGIQPAPIVDTRIQDAIWANVQATLGAARQLEVMEHLGPALFQKHQIVVDVDYYRARPKDSVGFHKDSTGHTLFVNLTFDNLLEGIATEYIVDKVGVKALEENLPQCFRDLLQLVRQTVTTGDKIKGGGILPICGRVSSIDALVFHSTPLLGHRQPAQLLIDFSQVLDVQQIDWQDVRQAIGEFLQRAMVELQQNRAKIDSDASGVLGLIQGREGAVGAEGIRGALSTNSNLADSLIQLLTPGDQGQTDWKTVREAIIHFQAVAIQSLEATKAGIEQRAKMAVDLIGERKGVVSGKELKEVLSIRRLDFGLTQTETDKSFHDLRLDQENKIGNKERRMSTELDKAEVKQAIVNQQTQDRRFIRTWVMALPL